MSKSESLPQRRNRLANELAKREGKGHEAQIGDIREMLKLLVTMEIEHMEKSGSVDGGPVGILRAEADAKYTLKQQAARKAAKPKEKAEDDKK